MLDTFTQLGYFPFLVIISMLAVFSVMPSILHVCRERKLFDSPVGFRKMHDHGIPRLGGMAIFFSFVLSVLCFTHSETIIPLKPLIVACILISAISLKDDLVGVDAFKKFFLHVFVSALLVTWGNIRLGSLHGIFGIYALDEISSTLISIGLITYIVNAFNLIDGINGLAGTIGLIASLVFGIGFIVSGQRELAAVALCLSGAIAGFLRYNFNPAKIFMGDTGAYLIGIVLSILALRFIEINPLGSGEHTENASFSFAMAVLVVPLFDTFRVVVIRLSQGRSPFDADSNHIHHKLLRSGMSHPQIVITLVLFNVLVLWTAWMMADFNCFWTMLFTASECVIFNAFTTHLQGSGKVARFSFRNFLW
ncbi:MAG: undecaprenyl/decaprenyl-phosphate alpha-N-acetylglucosaminyl 1-phosphate transferase [Mucilaginibacter polytrichastri]|nr:undecaprenyl/decaprenyl-phosphate alpha-N-acetylglucosaminyl 1-phosphate transferase [Mucilaginibacter polytrichastri]